ncbi:MAG: DUF1549 domain-containing protein [Phycisphaera sp.]|nr:DUF1549 domain-containing protein [Phycisphaera sp.]
MNTTVRSVSLLTAVAIVVLLAPRGAFAEDAAKPKFPGLGDPGAAKQLKVQLGHTTEADANKPMTIVGPDDRMQVVVTAQYDSGQVRDWTRDVNYAVNPANVVTVDKHGVVTPVGNGTAKITVEKDGLSSDVEVTVERFDNPPAINFPNQVTPIFTKLGCNSGGCHGKSGGQNGFRLSLLGFEPQKDYEYLVKEGRGRRLFPAAPDHSLLLLKGVNDIPHGGGERLAKDSPDYRIIRRWISQGMPYGSDSDPKVNRISVYPEQRIMPHDGSQQLLVVAHYTDGSTKEVTHTAKFEPNDKDMAEVNTMGLVTTMGRPGDVAIMVRYQGQVAVFNATVPLGIPVTNLPTPNNYVDEHVFTKLKQLGLPPSDVCDDATFIRRVSIDIAGRLPTLEEAQAFAADQDPKKRDRLIDRLLDSPEYADYFSNKWASILRNKRSQYNQETNYLFHEWLRSALAQNMPYDEMVRGVLTASGDPTFNPAVSWYNQVTKIDEQVEDTAQLFLGVRIQCARCHHHPFEKWSQDDYYGLAAFFSQVGRKPGLNKDESLIYHKRGTPQAKNPNSGVDLKPTGLGGEPLNLKPDVDPRNKLVDWMAAPNNPFFAKSLVNRYWKHFFGRGLVDPEDDMRETNPPTNPALLKALADDFIKSGFDLKHVVRTICSSKTYQFSANPNTYNIADTQSFSRYYPKRLNAEVLLDSIDQMNGTRTDFNGMPIGAKAVQIPDHGGVNSYFLTVFGRPAGASACECERTIDASLAQSLHLLNSQDIYNKLTQGRARELNNKKDVKPEDKITELYMRAFSRPPTSAEMNVAIAHINKAEDKDKQAAYEDVIWALINTKEFLFNH